MRSVFHIGMHSKLLCQFINVIAMRGGGGVFSSSLIDKRSITKSTVP